MSLFRIIRDNEKYQEGRKEGRKEGREEGRKEGREEGRKEGREEGRKKEKVYVIQRLINRNQTNEEIHELMEYPIDFIQEVRDKYDC